MAPSLRLAFREIVRSGPQSFLFVLSMVLALVTLVSLGGFSRSVQKTLMRDARELHAADVIVRSHRGFSRPLVREVTALEEEGEAESARLYDFYTMARTPDGSRSILSSLLVAPAPYPFYGKVVLESGRNFGLTHRPGSAVVERALLDRLGLSRGDTVLLGKASFVIADVLLREPDRPVNAFSIGPRIIVHDADLEALDLVKTGSRIHHRLLLRAKGENRAEEIAARLTARAVEGEERVETFRTARSGVKKFFDNFLFFLSLIGIFTFILAGFGIQSSLTALLREKRDTFTIVKVLGGTASFVARQAALMVAILAVTGTVAGVLIGLLVQRALPALFRGFVADTAAGISPGAIVEGCILGAVVTAVFTSIPLRRLRDIRPVAILGREILPPGRRLPLLLRGSLVVLFAAGLILWKIRDIETGIWFVLGVGCLITLAAAVSALFLVALKKLRPGRLVPRLIIRGLERPGSGTIVAMTTLVTSLSVIFAMQLIELNLDRTFVGAYPAGVPNAYFLDIQSSQREDFSRELGISATYYPVVRARVRAIAGEEIDRRKERKSRRDNFAREFNLTWRETLLEDEILTAGPGLFDPDFEGPQVSVLEEVLEMREMQLGDVISFTIAGVPMEARVVSFRKRVRSSVRPFFYFVFPPAILRDVPQTIFAAARLPGSEVAKVQARIVTRFPNVSVIDVTETVRVFSGVMRRLSDIIRFFTFFSIAAGLLIVFGAVLATRHVRLRESVYYRILGAKRAFVLRIFAAEHFVLGIAAAAAALFFAEAGSLLVCEYYFNIDFRPFSADLGVTAVAAVLLVVASGLIGSVPALVKRPIVFLREVTTE